MHEDKELVRLSTNPYRTHSVFIGYLAWLFGVFGAHRFYFGKRLTGLLWMCTGGLLLVGWIVDFFFIPSMAEEASRREMLTTPWRGYCILCWGCLAVIVFTWERQSPA